MNESISAIVVSNESATADRSAERATDGRIGLGTLGGYLIGHRDAILTLAGNRSTLWVGFLLVLSAGFAREYDGEDLLAEPWHLLIPLGASLGSSLILFALVWTVALRRQMQAGVFSSTYRSFLGLYWMTAPLAWVYALPVERFLSTADAVRANLWLLGLVALWRVVLIVRVISVLYGASVMAAAVLVLTFGDVLVFLLMQTVDLPLLQIMGGVRMTEAQRLVANTAETLIILSVLSAPVWLIGTAVVLFQKKPEWVLALSAQTSVGVTRGLKTLTAVALIVWFPLLVMTQPEQQLRTRVERLVDSGEYAEAASLMSSAGQDAFPPHFSPPPRLDRKGLDVGLTSRIALHTRQSDEPGWVREIYLDKLHHAFRPHYGFGAWWSSADIGDREALVQLLEELPTDEVQKIVPPGSRISENAYKTPEEEELALQTRMQAILKEARPSGEDH